jgi:hypothetical protein
MRSDRVAASVSAGRRFGSVVRGHGSCAGRGAVPERARGGIRLQPPRSAERDDGVEPRGGQPVRVHSTHAAPSTIIPTKLIMKWKTIAISTLHRV